MEEIDLKELLRYGYRKKFIIIATTLIIVLISMIYFGFIQKPKYVSSTTLILTGFSSNSEKDTINNNDLTINQKLVTTYQEITKTRKVLNQVIDTLKEYQNIEIIHIILKTLQEMLAQDDPRRKNVREDLITYVEDRKGHDRRYAIAPDKIKEEIGWYPETMFEEGIKKTIAWFFENEEWMKHVTSGDYQKYYEDMYGGK